MVIDVDQTHRGDHFVVYTNIQSLFCTPESYILLYANYISIKIKHLSQSQIYNKQ